MTLYYNSIVTQAQQTVYMQYIHIRQAAI